MTPEQFVYWLQGYVEIVGPHKRSIGGADEQARVWQEIKNHLELVMTKRTPTVNNRQDLVDMFKMPPKPATTPAADWTKYEMVKHPYPLGSELTC